MSAENALWALQGRNCRWISWDKSLKDVLLHLLYSFLHILKFYKSEFPNMLNGKQINTILAIMHSLQLHSQKNITMEEVLAYILLKSIYSKFKPYIEKVIPQQTRLHWMAYPRRWHEVLWIFLSYYLWMLSVNKERKKWDNGSEVYLLVANHSNIMFKLYLALVLSCVRKR